MTTSDTGASQVPATSSESAAAPTAIRRLTRSRSDRWIAGVAGGLAEYLGVDALLVRVALALLALASGGAVILFYLLAAFIIPDDRAGAAAPRRGNSAVAGVTFGLILVGVGIVWLLAALDLQPPRWDIALAAALVGVGGALVITAGRAGSGGLILLGVLLTLVLSGLSTVNLRVDSAFGERVARPASLAGLEREYSHAFGSFTLDLTGIEIPEGTTRIRVANSFGETIVRLPARAAVKVDASTAFGESRILGKTFSGVGSSQSEQTPDFSTATRRLEIELSTAFGSSEVRR